MSPYPTVMIVVRGNYRHNAQHVREIVGDLFQSQGIGEVADKALSHRLEVAGGGVWAEIDSRVPPFGMAS